LNSWRTINDDLCRILGISRPSKSDCRCFMNMKNWYENVIIILWRTIHGLIDSRRGENTTTTPDIDTMHYVYIYIYNNYTAWGLIIILFVIVAVNEVFLAAWLIVFNVQDRYSRRWIHTKDTTSVWSLSLLNWVGVWVMSFASTTP